MELLIWINGAYGSGKTSVARVLAARLGNAPIVDPEEVGFMLQRVGVAAQDGDFQDLPLWRRLTAETLAEAEAGVGPNQAIVVPMTIANRDYFGEIMSSLSSRGIEVRHFTLLASARTLRFRLLKRLDRPSATRWCLAQVDRCVVELERPEFALHLRTDRRKIGDIANEIAEAAGLAL